MNRQVKRLFRKIGQGKAVLFLGAGASKAAGLQSGRELAKALWDEFLPDSPQDSEDLIEVSSRIMDTEGIDRKDVEDFLRKTLYVQPSTTHKTLCRYSWQAIFTTNYDDLVESAYRSTPESKQRCEVVCGSEFSRRNSDYQETVRLFKLMGCVSGRDKVSQMALTRSDYNKKMRQRGGLLKILYDYTKDGTIIYIGYSFNDRISRDIIDEVVDEVGIDRLPWGWAVMPKYDQETEQFLRQRRILPWKISFEDFVSELSSTTLSLVNNKADQDINLSIGGVQILVPSEDFKMYSRSFEFVHDDIGVSTPDDSKHRRDFLEGKLGHWVGIAKGWAFLRTSIRELENILIEQLKRTTGTETPVILAKGPAGAGKSLGARLSAFRIYKHHQIPCIVIKPEREQTDFLVIDSFYRFIQEAMEESGVALKNVRKDSKKVPLLILVDGASAKVQLIRSLSRYLVSRGISAVILAITRENEWIAATKDEKLPVARSVLLEDLFSESDNEAERLLLHLRKIEVFESVQDDDYWIRKISSDYEGSFWSTLYALVEPTRPPLSLSIRNEYDQLPPLAQSAYRYVCIFYKFKISLDLELLARSLNCSYE